MNRTGKKHFELGNANTACSRSYVNPSFESLDMCASLGVTIKSRRLIRGHGGVGNFNSRGQNAGGING